MSEVTLAVTFNVNPPVQPLTVTPASEAINLTQDVPADGTAVASVAGGVPPYNYAADPNSAALPDGVSFAEDGNGNITLAGTPTTAGQGSAPVELDITDSAPVPNKAKVKVIV